MVQIEGTYKCVRSPAFEEMYQIMGKLILLQNLNYLNVLYFSFPRKIMERQTIL